MPTANLIVTVLGVLAPVLVALIGATWALSSKISAMREGVTTQLTPVSIRLAELQNSLTAHTAEERARDEKLTELMTTLRDQDKRLRTVEMGDSFRTFLNEVNKMLGRD